jgi:hypothetical protein
MIREARRFHRCPIAEEIVGELDKLEIGHSIQDSCDGALAMVRRSEHLDHSTMVFVF